jgi:hypothetical protein
MPAIYTAPPVLAMTDPMEECFDVLDEDGRPTGEVLLRSAVHRLGRGHRAFHLFLVGRWESYLPDPLELMGLVAVPLAELVALLEGERAQVEGQGLILEAGAWRSGRRSFGKADLVHGDEENLLRVARAAMGWMIEES